MDPYTGMPTSAVEPDMPLAFAALDNPVMRNLPGFPTSMAFSTFRGTNTLMKGGFLERGGFVSRRLSGNGPISSRITKNRLNRYKMINPETGLFNDVAPGHFAGRTSKGVFSRRSARLAESADKSGFFRSARVNNVTMRPRAFGSYHSTSVFTDRGYSPFGMSRFIGKSSRISAFAEKRNISIPKGESAIGPGFLSFVSAGTKTDALERRALSGNKRALRKLGTVDKNIRALAEANNPGLLKQRSKVVYKAFDPALSDAVEFNAKRSLIGQPGKGSWNVKAGKSIPLANGEGGRIKVYTGGKTIPKNAFTPMTEKVASNLDTAMGRAVGVAEGPAFAGRAPIGGEVGVRGNLLASSMAGGVTRYAAGYVRGAGGHGILQMAGESEKAFMQRGAAKGLFKESLKGSEQAIKTFGVALEKTGITFGGKAGAEAAELALKGSVFKNLGKEGVMKTLGTKAGAKVLGIRAASLAIPGLNIIGAAMMAYDIGKMAGDVVKSGINLAKDATTSMKGSISKPLFGMGYKDTEAAATSRARGVMAIQNSQLNARSILGSEAGMLAAHFG